ncbi:PAS domain-containing protein [Devosia sp. SL43]|uniref:PAS domain-containing protein n=1 Tax=Devosia sp. SL43 TaxID=2806348 RepID=UPI001F302730|nr:PAS domain-containing protein [Devosia sp. SL43]UJW84789.1 PAS domain-containing protein [Devosia sp. SL43]
MTDVIADDQTGVFDFMPGFVAILRGPEHVFEYTNDAYRALAGMREFAGRTVREVFPELTGQGFYELLDGVYTTGKPFTARSIPVTLDQDEGDRVIDLLYNPMRDRHGRIDGIFVGGYDVTEAYRAQERWRVLAELSDRMRDMTSPEDLVYTASEILGRALGVTRVGFGTIDADDVLHVDRDWNAPGIASLVGETRMRDYGSFIDSLRRGETVTINDTRDDPRTASAVDAILAKSVRSFVNVPVVEHGKLVAMLLVNHIDPRQWREDELTLIREVADRVRTGVQRLRHENELRQSEEVYRSLFDAIDEGFCIIEFFDGPHGPLSDYVHIQANAAYARHAGIPNVVGQKLREMVGDEADEWVRRYGGVLRTGQPIRFEQELIATGRHLELSAVRIEPPSRKQVAVLFQDVTARRKAEAALRQSEEQFRVFAQAVPNQVWASRPDGNLYWFNDQVYAYSGEAPGSLDGMVWGRIVHPDDLEVAARNWINALSVGEIYETEFRIRRHDGTYRWFLVRAEPVRASDGSISHWIGTNTDIENTKRQAEELADLNATLEQQVEMRTAELMAAEETLRQAQKMEAVGQLTGGLAHDFNNILAGIGGSLEMMSTRLAQGRIGDLDRYITGASGAARRAAGLTQRLLAFSRRQTLDPKPTNLNSLVNGMLDLVTRSVGPGVEVETAGGVGLWTTFVDAGQLENALLNLCINARDAMPDGGKLTIETSNRWMDERSARERGLAPGQYISLCVSDTGTGMSADVIARAFDPFFTTKPIGQGTGLGLSMVYGFAGQSGGAVRIYSEAGKGSMVCIYLPRFAGEAEVDDADLGLAPDAPRSEGHETILVVDDEPLVRMIATEQLEELGYTVLEAADGPTALKILNSNRTINLLITDVGLPSGMNGRQLADAARVSRPNLEVLFITGYAENAVLNHGHLDPGMHVMTKPFQMDTFARRVKDLIAKDVG